MKEDIKTKYWDLRRNKIRSKKGGWIIGEKVDVQGYSLLDEFPGKASFFQLLYLHVLDNLPSKELSTWLEASFMCLSYPDARLWCNQVAALGGSARVSPTAAICAGVLASDSLFYGPGAVPAIEKFFTKARQSINGGMSINIFVEEHCLLGGVLKAPGFNRPIAKGDERVDVLVGLARRLRIDLGSTVKMALDLSNHFYASHGESINAAGLIVAFWMDHGLNAKDITTLYSLSVNAGVHACYSEALSKEPDSFLPLRCEDILYRGPSSRQISNKKC